jgi:hypothetical protein
VFDLLHNVAVENHRVFPVGLAKAVGHMHL